MKQVTTLSEDPAPADPHFDARGFSDRRDAGSLLPFEHIDPFTGNLLLTFTDLRLPGNGGFDLVVQRTYNSKIFSDYGLFYFDEDSWAGVGWSLHMGRVIEPPYSGGRAIVEMPDGSSHPVYSVGADPQDTITRTLWRYDSSQNPPVLYLTNGRTYRFGHLGNATTDGRPIRYVTQITDPYGNRIDVSYWYPSVASAPRDAIRTITQHLETGRTRSVKFTYDSSARKALYAMTYADGSRTRTWRYGQSSLDRHPSALESMLDWVQAPQGSAWSFGYNVSTAPYYELTGLTTPNGGSVSYTYEWHWYRYCRIAIQPTTYPIAARGVVRRATGGRDITPGTWTFAYAQGSLANQTIVASPCNTTRYRFYGIGGDSGEWCPYENGTRVMWAYKIGAQLEKEALEGSTLLQRESLDWAASDFIAYGPETVGHYTSGQIYNPLLTRRTVNRPRSSGAVQNYVTTHQYRAGSYNDYGRPWRTVESGQMSRTTERVFDYNFTPYIRDRVASETVSVSGESPSYTRSAGYRNADGFQESESIYGVRRTFGSGVGGNVAWVRDDLGNQTSFTYAWGVLDDTHTPKYAIDRLVNADGTVERETRRGFATRFAYDLLFRRTMVAPPIGNASITTFDDAGTYVRVTRGPSELRRDLDGFGRPTGTLNSQGVTTDVDHDSCGRVSYESYAFTGTNNTGTSFARDGLGRLRQATHPDGSWTKHIYDSVDVTVQELVRSGYTRSTIHNWSAFGDPDDRRLSSLKDGAGQTWTYAYNTLGRLRLVTPPSGGNRIWSYNAKNQLQSEYHPERGTTAYTYDDAGNIWTRTDAKSQTTVFTHDGNGRLVFADGPGNADTSFGWDASDNRTRTDNGRVVSDFVFDGNNRLQQRTDTFDSQTFVTGYDYDANDNLGLIEYPSGLSVTYTPNSEGQVRDVRKTGSTTAFAGSFLYHPSGAVRSFTLGNGKVQTFSYGSRYRIDSLKNGVLDLNYDHDYVGNVENIWDNGRSGMNQSFGYDGVDRLWSASGWWGAGTIAYTADGNRQSSTLGGSRTYFHTAGRLMTVTGAGADAFDYDANGNMRSSAGGANTYAYSPENFMESATVGGVTTTYRYDADGLRKRKTGGGSTRYFVHGLGSQLLAEYESMCGGGTRLVKNYVYAGSRLVAAVSPAVPTVTLESSASTVAEAVGTAPVRVRITTPAGTPTEWAVCVSYSSANGTAIAGADYGATQGVLTFPVGVTSGTTVPINVPIFNDPDMNDTESFSLRLTSAQGASLADGATHTVTIQDDDAPIVAFALPSSTAGEASGTSPVLVKVTSRDGQPLVAQASVSYATVNGSAVGGQDYVTAAGVLTFPVGFASGGALPIPATLSDDGLNEDAETFQVALSNPTNAIITPPLVHTVTISDDDPLPPISIEHATAVEPVTGSADTLFVVTLGAASGREVRVNYATADVSATAGSDYVAASGVLTFPPGTVSQTIAVRTLSDDLDEANEAFLLRLHTPVNAALVDDEAQGEIIDEDGGAGLCAPIATVPYTISASGQYCLVRHLALAAGFEAAIRIEADSVVLNLSGFTLSGPAVGPRALVFGVHAQNRSSVTVKGGGIEGFSTGVFLDDTSPDASGSGGHLILEIHAADNTRIGLDIRGRGNVVRGNRVSGTGGRIGRDRDAESYGVRTIGSSPRILNNDVTGTRPSGRRRAHGIAVWDGAGAVVERNRVGNDTVSSSLGIWFYRAQDAVSVANRISGMTYGILFENSTGKYRGNVCSGTTTPYSGGTDAGNNR